MLIDPSGRGGIVRYTRLVSEALSAVGGEPIVLESRGLLHSSGTYKMRRWLPRQRWGRPGHARAWPGFYAGRASAWLLSMGAIEAAIRVDRPDVLHFHAPISRRFDAVIVRRARRHAPVVWTAHDVIPPEPAPHDENRFALIYQAADLVLVHGEVAATDIQRLTGVEPTIIEHVPDDTVRIERLDARRQLGLPENERILGAIGFVRAYKGYELLAEVWQHLGAEAPLLLVIGETVGEEGRRVLARLRRSRRVIVRPGYVSDENFRLGMSAVDALVLPYISASESGLVHMARALGVPLFVSDAPPLVSAARRMGGGIVLPRQPDIWASAVLGPLPGPPSPPPSREVVGRAHLAAYEDAIDRARARWRGARPS
jgi:glycosyltransferase involved in cell wall biosynthesis